MVALPVCKPPIVLREHLTGLEVSMRKKSWPAPESALIEISGAAPTAAAYFFLICFLISAYVPTDYFFIALIYLSSVFKSYIVLNRSILCLISIFYLVYNYFIWTYIFTKNCNSWIGIYSPPFPDELVPSFYAVVKISS